MRVLCGSGGVASAAAKHTETTFSLVLALHMRFPALGTWGGLPYAHQFLINMVAFGADKLQNRHADPSFWLCNIVSFFPAFGKGARAKHCQNRKMRL